MVIGAKISEGNIPEEWLEKARHAAAGKLFDVGFRKEPLAQDADHGL